jgi:hypothetical protein
VQGHTACRSASCTTLTRGYFKSLDDLSGTLLSGYWCRDSAPVGAALVLEAQLIAEGPGRLWNRPSVSG